MASMMERNVTSDMVQEYIDNAAVMFCQWKNTRRMYVSEDEVTIALLKGDNWIAKTTWSKCDFDEEMETILKVVRKYGK